MREALLGKLVLHLSRATPEELAATYRFVKGQSVPKSQPAIARALPEPVLADASAQAGIRSGPAYVFRRVCRHWEVVCGGGRAFRLRNTLGARYLDYLLHEPNEPIRAFDLEVEAQPEKGEARVRDSFQPERDAQALREYRQEARRLRTETGQAAGGPEGGAGR